MRVQRACGVAVLVRLVHLPDAPRGIQIVVAAVDRYILVVFDQVDGADHIGVERIAERECAAEILLQPENLDLGERFTAAHHLLGGAVRGQVVHTISQGLHHAVSAVGEFVQIHGNRLTGGMLQLTGYGMDKIDAGGDNRCEYQNTYHHNDQPDKRDLAFCHTIHLTGDSANHTRATPYNGAAELP